jgi:ParB-like chromosome segregation protein Spo0J
MMQIQEIKVSELIPYARNAKQHPREQLTKIMQQIHTVGFLVPIVVDKDMTVIAGHGRLEAAKELEMETVPVIVADHLTEDQAMAWRIADNKVAESPWDMPMLAFELGTLERNGIDLTLTGFDMAEARAVLASFGASNPSDSSSSDGSREVDESETSEFKHKCPRCEFEWN